MLTETTVINPSNKFLCLPHFVLPLGPVDAEVISLLYWSSYKGTDYCSTAKDREFWMIR